MTAVCEHCGKAKPYGWARFCRPCRTRTRHQDHAEHPLPCLAGAGS